MMERSRSKSDIFRDTSRRITDVQQQVGVLFNRDVSVSWIPPTLLNSWINNSNGSDGNHTVAYSRDSDGTVRVRGLAKNGTVGLPIFVLPVGFRPGNSGNTTNQGLLRFPVVTNGGFGFAYVYWDGQVILAVGSNVWVDLAPINFRAEL